MNILSRSNNGNQFINVVNSITDKTQKNSKNFNEQKKNHCNIREWFELIRRFKISKISRQYIEFNEHFFPL